MYQIIFGRRAKFRPEFQRSKLDVLAGVVPDAAAERLGTSMHLCSMKLATQHYWPASNELREAPEGIWFEMVDGNGTVVRCLLERTAWIARDAPEADMLAATAENWSALVMLASQKLSLTDPAPQTELHLTADDLFNIPWQTRSKD